MVCTALANSPGAGESHLLAADALDHYALGAPSIDLAEGYVLGFVMSFEALKDFHFLSIVALT
jgi:hypothetical protein